MDPNAEALNRAMRLFIRDRMRGLERQNIILKLIVQSSDRAAHRARIAATFNDRPPYSVEELRNARTH